MLSENLHPQKTQCSQSRENLLLEKPQASNLSIILVTLSNINLDNQANHILSNINLDILPLVNLVNLGSHTLASLCKVTLSRVTFPKVN